MSVEVRPAGPEDEAWVRRTVGERWGGRVVARGEVFDLTRFPALVAWRGGRRVGVATVRGDASVEAELMSLDSLEEGRGVGSALIEAACAWARSAGARRLRAVTTNDNLRALGLYQRRGFRLALLRCGAVDEGRRLKPEIPEVGAGGIPLHDELELVRALDQRREHPLRSGVGQHQEHEDQPSGGRVRRRGPDRREQILGWGPGGDGRRRGRLAHGGRGR